MHIVGENQEDMTSRLALAPKTRPRRKRWPRAGLREQPIRRRAGASANHTDRLVVLRRLFDAANPDPAGSDEPGSVL
jgi:hypothetical protein